MTQRRDLVLIVNNDQAVRDSLQFALQLEGFCVHVHSGGATLLQDPDLGRARCIILDERMKHMDGFTVLDALQERKVSLPTILLTSNATARLRERADRIGVRNVLEKPLLGDTLVESIRSILDSGSAAET
ncbi:MAG TPA: response regulator [Rhodopila sp.]|nr:response regulator [Rhodopila sp.]